MMRDALRALLTRTLDLSGVARLLRGRFAGEGVIFTFHRVVERPGDTADPGLAVTADLLDRMLGYVRRSGWDVVDMDGVAERLTEGRRGGARFVACTFDDGFLDNLTLALPVFRRHAAPMTVYAVPGLLDRSVDATWVALDRLVMVRSSLDIGTATLDSLPCATLAQKRAAFLRLLGPTVYGTDAAVRERVLALCAAEFGSLRAVTDELFMNWEQLRTFAADAHARVGSHTLTHPALAQLPRERALVEMRDSAERLAGALGRPVRHLCYPFGGVDQCGPREFALAAELGYRTAVTTRTGNIFAGHRERMHALPRIAVTLLPGTDSLSYVRTSLFGTQAAIRNGFRPSLT